MKCVLERHKWIAGLVMLGLSGITVADDDDNNNIVVDIINAPVLANGLVADAATEFNLILNAPKADDQNFALDPAEFGHQIPAGGRMEIEMSGAFIINPDVEADPAKFKTNAHVILTTGPQNPIHGNAGDSVQLGNWTAALTPNSSPGSHLITITPDGGQGKNGLEGDRAREIGVKVAHVRPRAGITPFTNGPVGSVGTVAVRIYDKDGELKEAGFDEVMFRSKDDVGPQVSITNQGVRTGGAGAPQPSMESNENTNFQRVAANTSLTSISRASGTTFSENAPYAPRFMLFEAAAAGEAKMGIVAHYLVDPARPWLADLFDAGGNIGSIIIRGPSEASRGMILTDPTTSTNIMSVPVKVGADEGIYTVTVRLIGGNETVNTIIVGDDDDD